MKTPVLIALSLICTPLYAKDYSPQALLQIEKRVTEAVHQGETPVVMFDLDDTLIDTRDRTVRIIHDFASLPDSLRRFPEDALKLFTVTESDIRYLTSDTLAGLGIANQALAQALGTFWADKFFSSEYCSKDQPAQGPRTM